VSILTQLLEESFDGRDDLYLQSVLSEAPIASDYGHYDRRLLHL